MTHEAPPIAVFEIASAEDVEQVGVTGRITPQRIAAQDAPFAFAMMHPVIREVTQ